MHRIKFGLGRSLIKIRVSSLSKCSKEFDTAEKFQHIHHSSLPADISSKAQKSTLSGISNLEGTHIHLCKSQARECTVSLLTPHRLGIYYGGIHVNPYFVRFLSSSSSSQRRQNSQEHSKDISSVDDPLNDLSKNVKPVTFPEGVSYSLVILAGLGIAGAAGYAVFKELIFQPKEYKIFGKALERVQNDHQVRARIGSPITGYGQETRNRAARQRIPNRIWTDEDGIEHVEVNFYIRGPHGAGKVYSEMFKDKIDKQWKYTFLIVEITSPIQKQLMLESYVPA